MAKIESTGPLTATLDGGAGRKPTFEIAGEGIIEFETTAEMDAAVKLRSPDDPLVLNAVSEIEKEKLLCRDIIDDLRLDFKKQVQLNATNPALGLTIAQATDVFNRTNVTFNALGLGWLRESRVLANNTATGGSFTQARKDFLLSKIDNAISQL